MALAWLLLAPIGMITAILMKKPFKKMVVGTELWFTIHRPLMVMTFILTVIGILTVFAFKKWTWIDEKHSKLANQHAVLGLTIIRKVCNKINLRSVNYNFL